MKKKSIIRIITFILLLVLFIISALIAIILAQGRTITNDGNFEQTSIILLSSSPNNVDTKIDDKPVQVLDRRIEWIEPGIRNMKVSKEGYSNWNRDLKVESGVITEVFAQLYPNEFILKNINEQDVNKVYFTNDREYVYYFVLNSEVSQEIGLWRYKLTRNFLDLNPNAPQKISSLDSFINSISKNEFSIDVSSDNQKLILFSKSGNIFSLININTGLEESNLVNELGFIPDRYYWFRNSTSLIIEKNNLLFEYELSTNQRGLIDFSFEKQLIYSVNSNFVIFKNTQNNNIYIYRDKVSSIFNLGQISSLDKESVIEIQTVTGNDEIYIFKSKDNFFYLNLDKSFFEKDIALKEILGVSSNGRLIIYSLGDQIYSYSLRNTPNNLSLVSSINKFDIERSQLKKVFINPNSEGVMFFEGDQDLSLSAYDFQGKNRTILLKDFKLDFNSNILMSSDLKKLYFVVNTQNSRKILTSTDLVLNN